MKKKIIKAELAEIRQRLSHLERLAAIKWYFELPKKHKSSMIPDPNMRLFEDHSIHILTPKNHIIPPDEELIKELPKAWEDLSIDSKNKGYFDHIMFASIKELESAKAKGKLSQVMKVYRAGWVPKKGKSRYAIMPDTDDVLKVYQIATCTSPLSFETEKIATQFLNNFRPLINQFFMIE